jgi:hypothetical protein
LFGNDDILAWTAASDTGWTFANAPAKPRVFLRADIASGDHGGSNLGTFNPLFPRGAYFNDAALIGPQNLMDLQPGIDFMLTKSLKLTTSCDFVWRESLDDGVYGVALNLQLPPGGANNRHFRAHHRVATGPAFESDPQLRRVCSEIWWSNRSGPKQWQYVLPSPLFDLIMPIHRHHARCGQAAAEFQRALLEFLNVLRTAYWAQDVTPPPGSNSREYGILRTFANEASVMRSINRRCSRHGRSGPEC